ARAVETGRDPHGGGARGRTSRGGVMESVNESSTGWTRRVAPVAGALAVVVAAAACAPAEREEDPGDTSFLEQEMMPEGSEPGDTIPGSNWTWEDWTILSEKVRWSVAEGLDTAPLGEAVARLGVTFVGTTYTPGTL